MTVTIMGSGTSTGVPPIGCTHTTCLSDDPKNKRLRAGLLLREPAPVPHDKARALIVDCGPDFRQQALTHDILRLDGVLLTHAHFDHIAGIDDLRIYNFRQHHALPVFALASTLADLRRRYDYLFDPPQIGGGVASLDLRPVEGPFDFTDMHIVPIPAMHGMLPIIGFRFGDFSFVTDASELPESSRSLIRGSRVLVLNALRPQPHPTHFSLDEAVDVARDLGAEQSWFVHMTHHLEHHETNRRLPANIQLAWDGLQFDINAEPTS